ncbi:MAG: VCBS repeat-containing protein, partial [Myxococcota bacterium]|nr:VCBS repeat-containing protein [Myxococcota bacterium]
MQIRTRLTLAACLTLTLAVVACASEPAAQPPEVPSSDDDAVADAGDAVADAGDAQENKAPSGAPAPTVMLSQAWFERVDGKPKPGPARIEMWRQGKDGNWTMSRLHDPDSNVFHKAIWTDDGLLTIGAEKANLKRWTRVDGTWKGETLWTNSWGGKFNRLRDIEIGDVDHDGKDEYVIASHDAGVVAVYHPGGEVIELDRKADTFVHEIEIGDIDGDGKLEFFATPSDRNQAGKSQHGMVVMYRWDGKTYQRSIVDPGEGTHAKEVLVADIDGDGTMDRQSSRTHVYNCAGNLVTTLFNTQDHHNDTHRN